MISDPIILIYYFCYISLCVIVYASLGCPGQHPWSKTFTSRIKQIAKNQRIIEFFDKGDKIAMSFKEKYLDCETSCTGFMFTKVEFGTLVCIIAASGLVPLGRASECGIPMTLSLLGFTRPWISGREGILENALDDSDTKLEDVPPSRKWNCLRCCLLASLLAFQFKRNLLAVSLISLPSSVTVTAIGI